MTQLDRLNNIFHFARIVFLLHFIMEVSIRERGLV